MPFPTLAPLATPNLDITTWSLSSPEIRDPSAPIYISASNARRHYTHASARCTIRQLINGVRAYGLRKGDTICVHAFSSVHYPVLVNGIVGAGCIWSGTNPGYTKGEMIHALRIAEVKMVVVEREIMSSVLAAADEIGLSRDRILMFDHDDLESKDVSMGEGDLKSWRTLLEHGEGDWESWDDEHRSKNTTAARLFSSGTTGLPKAAKLSHYNFIAQHVMVNDYRPKKYKEKRIMTLPSFHVAAAPSLHFSPLRNGVPTYIPRRFDLKPFLRTIASHGITDMAVVPPIVISIIMNASLTQDPEYSLRSVRFATCGAAPLEKGPQRRLWRLLGCNAEIEKCTSKGIRVSPELEEGRACFTQVWGMTETTCIGINFPYYEEDDTGSVGYPLPGLTCKLVDDQGHDVSTAGTRGELCVKGPTVIDGYLDDKATRSSWDDSGFFMTGDVAFVEEKSGKWYIVDRKKELIKVRGWQVAPPELEAVLLSHEKITDAAIIGVKVRENGEHGGETEVPRAYVVRRNEQLGEQEVKAYIADKLAKYKRLEGGVVFVDAVPRNPSGKILKRVLRERAEEEMNRSKRDGSKL